MSANLGPQFGDVPQGMEYRRAPNSAMRRAHISDPEVEPVQRAQHRGPDSAKHDYWSPEVRITQGQRGPLKKPKVFPNPNVSDPHTVAFADFHDESYGENREHKALYVDYVTTRRDQAGRGHARRLIEGIADAHPDHELDFGKVMSPGVWKIKESLEAQGRKTRGHRDF